MLCNKVLRNRDSFCIRGVGLWGSIFDIAFDIAFVEFDGFAVGLVVDVGLVVSDVVSTLFGV